MKPGPPEYKIWGRYPLDYDNTSSDV